MQMLSGIGEKIKNILDDTKLEYLAKQSGLIKRSRKITGKGFLLSLLLTTLESEFGTLSELSCELSNWSCDVSRQAVHKKCNDKAIKFMQDVLKLVMDNLRVEVGANYLEQLSFIKSIYVFDSSEIQLNAKFKDEFKHVRGQSAAFKLQTQIDALSGVVKDFEICRANETDQSYRGHLPQTNSPSLFIGDLGYFRVDSFTTIIEHGGYFLSRYFKRATVYDVKTDKQIDLNKILADSQDNIVELPIYLGAAKLNCRLVALKLDDESYKKRLSNLALTWKKDKRLKGQIAAIDRWTVFVTNLPNNINANLVFHLYKLRWQIELFFKMMKSFFNLRKINHSNRSRMLLSVYASIIAMGLLSIVSSGLADIELSLYNAGKFFIKTFRQFISKVVTNPLMGASWISNILRKYAQKESRANRLSTLSKIMELQHV